MIEVLLATYNGETYLKEQLDSLLAQTYQDFRILIRDDDSTDSTVSLLEEYREAYPDKIILVKDGVHCGNAARNFMELTKHATAEYVMYCDQDDFWLPQKLEVSLRDMKATEEKAGKDTPILVYGDYKIVDENLKDAGIAIEEIQVAKHFTDMNRILVQNYATGCLVMANRKLYKMLGEYDPDVIMHDWWLALIASAMGIVHHFPMEVMYYRQHGDNVVGAVRVKSFRYRWKKLIDPTTKKKKDTYFAQGRLLMERFGDVLPENNKKMLEQFLEIPKTKRKIARIKAILSGNFLKSDFIRNLGFLYYI